MSSARSYLKRRWKHWLLLVCSFAFLFGIDRALKVYYYSKTYDHRQVGDVYWEDDKTALFLEPDRYLFWRYKPHIEMQLTTPLRQYGLYWIGPREVPNEITVATNSRGYRAPDFDCAKPPNTFRIFSLGDSRTMGQGVERDERYTERLERLLDASSDGIDYQVINAATDGYTSYQGRVLLERELVECEPDLVTVMFGINDQDWEENIRDREKAKLFDTPIVTLSKWANRSMLVYFLRFQTLQLKGSIFGKTRRIPTFETSPAGKTRKVPLDDYAFNLNYIDGLGRENGFETVYIVVPSSLYSFLRRLYAPAPEEARADLSRAQTLYADEDFEGAERVLEDVLERYGDIPAANFLLARCYQHFGRWSDAYDQFVKKNRQVSFAAYEDVVRRFARANGKPLVDLTPEFTEKRREPLYVDDMHPNALGQQIIAEALFEKVREVIAN